ncbi:MAG TPA: cytochrome c family protein [Rhizomicrobium sp.]|jgi:cytochrome c|nr:cytochrome c family protein [Rhizomicrobium sp.]
MRGFVIAAAATLALGFAAPANAAGDAANGKTVFSRCSICHNAAKGAGNKIGPNLFGVVGRKAGTLAGFNYSAAMKGFGKTWTPQLLDTYLTHPGMTVPGTKMSFAGLSNVSQRADVVAYLQTLK